MVITVNGNLWAWGRNDYGQLENGTKSHQCTPVKIMEDVVAVSAGENHTMALTSDGVLWTWDMAQAASWTTGHYLKA